MNKQRQGASFRDPDGFLFEKDGTLYRQINESYREDYQQLMSSGLYEELANEGLLVKHQEAELGDVASDAYKVIKPQKVPFISYPYEWSFSQLKDAALLTLEIQQRALEKGMSLKDASAYNVQFQNGKPIFIDTLSFETYQEGKPWVAYRQFCQHFLAPLTLASYKDVRLFELLKHYIDGIPLDLANTLLPFRAKMRPGLFFHLYLHSKSQKRYEDTQESTERTMSLNSLKGVIDSLRRTTEKLEWIGADTEWGEYYQATNYSDEAMQNKEDIVAEFLQDLTPETVWDMGANTGRFSRIAAETAKGVVAFDVDVSAVERHYRRIRQVESRKLKVESEKARGIRQKQKAKSKKQKSENGLPPTESRILPLLQDLTNPSSSIGWGLTERDSLIERGPADAVMALALVHHLAIGNNVPLKKVAEFFARITKQALIIEFVPKDDSQVERLLATREDIFPDYSQSGFESAFKTLFTIERTEVIQGSKRVLYLMQKKQDGEDSRES